jgi:enoyl-CoA hydratase/carnithine racemase
MSSVEATSSTNGRGSPRWYGSWTRFSVDRRSASYCRVTFDHPPINTITATTVAELAELVELIENDPDLNVVVFDSANPDFYLAGPTGLEGWPELLGRLSRAPVISLASIRGRVCGAGSDFVLACDLRFASRENTLIGQFEIGPAPLARLVGRGRALELLLVADDLDGPRAELYGYVNRAIADDRLDYEIDAMAARLAGFEQEGIARNKRLVESGRDEL